MTPDLKELLQATVNIKDDDAIASDASENANSLKVRILLGRKGYISWPKLVIKAGF